MLALAILMTAGTAVVIAATDVPGCRGERDGCPAQDTTALMLMGVHVAQIAAVALAAAAICAEFQPRLIRATLAMKPQRRTVFAAKMLVVCGAVLVTARSKPGRPGRQLRPFGNEPRRGRRPGRVFAEVTYFDCHNGQWMTYRTGTHKGYF